MFYLRNIYYLYVFISLLLLTFSDTESSYFKKDSIPCAEKIISEEAFKMVCVCNETYCDTIGSIKIPEKGKFLQFISDKAGKRMEKSVHSYHQNTNADFEQETKREYKIKMVVNRTLKFQKILGFGGAFTDAAGINVASLPKGLQQTLIRSYFARDGIGYTIGRIPIGGCDFSTRQYTYDDTHPNDLNLSSFSLQKEDYKYKLPFLRLAKSLCQTDLLLYASPWSAPAWMKSNNDFSGRGFLYKEFYGAWADYIVKFLKAYEQNGIKMWGVTTQNEPIDGLIPFFPFNAMGWTPYMQRDWIKNNLGPFLHENGFDKLKIMILDDSTLLLNSWTQIILDDEETSQFVSGIGVHWYTRFISGYNGLGEISKLYPDKFILATEACNGFLPWETTVDLGSWERGEMYAEDIIQQLRQGVVGWTDWNLALSLDGGPNWATSGADSPIIVNKERKEFYKQPMFYAMAHFSKFFIRNSQIISGSLKTSSKRGHSKEQVLFHENSNIFTHLHNGQNEKILKNLFTLTAMRPDGVVVSTILNKNDFGMIVYLFDSDLDGSRIVFNIEANSITTILYT